MGTKLSLFLFADASKSDEYGQIGVHCGLLFGKLELDAVFHLLSWTSHKTRRRTKSVPAAEILEAGERIDDAKVALSVLK